jgi:holo-[acyl-carrier protein] synthase
MIHTGIDLVPISRIQKILDTSKENFLHRICTPLERESLKLQDGNPERFAQKVAGLFALKEAFSKALGTGIGESLSFQELEITHSTLGKPQISYLGEKYAYLASKWEISCSLTHDEDLVIALVAFLGEV